MPADLASTPTFSVVMPVYNHAAYVGQAIQSVCEQTRDDWELLIVDDGSTDGSAAVAEDWAGRDGRITVLRQANAGPAAARNAAIARARAAWLAYLDSDDLWYPHALVTYADAIARHPDARFFYGYRHRLEPGGRVTELPAVHQDRPTGTAELWERMYLSHLCVCYRRDLLDAAGAYDEALGQCEDYELYLRLSLHTRFEPIGVATGLRRRHGQNLSRPTGYSRLLEAEVLRRFAERQGGAAVLEPGCVAARLGRLYYAAGRQYFRAGCFRQARAAVRQGHRYRRSVKSTALGVLAAALGWCGRSDPRRLPPL